MCYTITGHRWTQNMARNPQIRVPEPLHPYVKILISLYEREEALQAAQQIINARTLEAATEGWGQRTAA